MRPPRGPRRDHEFRGRDRPAEDERVRGGVFALPDLRRRDPRLAREFLDGPEEPRIRIRGDWLAAANRPAHDRGGDEPLDEDEEEGQAEDDREGGWACPALEDVVDDDEDREEEQGQQRERSEEHTSELQSQSNLVCRLLLEKKKQKT